MNNQTIKFGTDGWRAIIADSFTFENVRIIAQAMSDYLISEGNADSGIAISFDTRFLSDKFARTLAEVFSSNAIPVYLSDRSTPTPVLSFAVKRMKLAGGIMVTASHNPYFYNGVKFKANYGGPAMSELTGKIENWLYKNKAKHDSALIQKKVSVVDLFPDYADHIVKYINWTNVNALHQTIVFDAMNAAGSGYLNRLLNNVPIELKQIHQKSHPTFDGRLPEPILKNLGDLHRAVKEQSAIAGFATDGDADRFGVLDENGNFVELHDLMPLLFSHLVETRGWRGNVVRTTSMNDTIDKMAAEHDRQVTEVPVGFKHVCEQMLNTDVLIGGEESGGFGYKNHIPERDGLLSILLILEMMGARQKPLSEMVRELRRKYGPFCYGRIDKHFDLKVLQHNLHLLSEMPPEKIGSFTVDNVSLIDGIKFYFVENSWMLIRVSQTEPLARIYVGSDENETVNRLLEEGVALMTRMR